MIQPITANEQVRSEWSGGTTTQLFIYPKESSYAERNFSLRISTATIDVEESDFTALPGYERLLMILDGNLLITHNHQSSKPLLPYEVHAFSGDWQTSAKGKVIDFNVIYHPNLTPSIRYLSLVKQQTHALSSDHLNFLYLVSGELTIDEKIIHAKEAVFIQQGSSLFIQAQEPSKLIIVSLPELL